MLNPTTDQEWVDDFLLGQLSETAIVSFQQRLEQDTAFALFFEEQKVLVDGLRLAQLSEQVQYFQGLNVLIVDNEGELEDEIIEEAVRVKRTSEVLKLLREKNEQIDKKIIFSKNRKRLTWLVAASFIFMLGLSFLGTQDFSNNALAEKYSYAIDFSTVRSVENQLVINQEVLSAYLSREYELANNLLQGEKENASAQIILLQGYIYLKLNRPQEAIIEFETIQDSRFIDNAKWHKSLAFLKMDNIGEGKRLLKEFINSEKPWYSEQAIKLLSDIEHPLRKIYFLSPNKKK